MDSFKEFWWPLYRLIAVIGFPILIFSVVKLSTKIYNLNRGIETLNYENKSNLKIIKDLKECIVNKDNLFTIMGKIDNVSIKTISQFYSDFLTVQYDISEKYLKTKSHPAYKEAMRIAELKQDAKKHIIQFKEIQYRYEALLNLFPELSVYIEDFETIKYLNNIDNIEGLVENYDRSRDYLTKEDYERLNTDERNQLALNNYIKRNKTKWQIGRDYEMFCAYKLRTVGYRVIEFGIDKKLEDMGRDLIAHDTDGSIKVIQCKYWSNEKLIHEKHIAQLYGTTIMFELENESLFKNKIHPVFMTNITLSVTAKRFAEKLGVNIVDKFPFEEFPRIKCNINNGTKIYHLPFDQQYDRTKIENEGEFYATSVKEAISKGFRRAFRHLGN